MRNHNIRHTGFTLIELVIVIVITGIISGITMVFLKTPVDQYIDITRRAAMTDIADIALQRMTRDLRTAVPNSVRLSGGYLEFLPTKAGGRYRANALGSLGLCAAAGDELSFTAADSCFEMTSPAINFTAGDSIVIGSTQADGNAPYNSSATGVLRAYTGAVGAQTKVIITATKFPAFASLPSQRFAVVSGSEQAVTYACENVGGTVDGTGTLKRYWAYGFNIVQTAPPTGGFSALLANNISACAITYNAINQRNGLITIALTILHGGERIHLYSEIHVDNMP
jgi:MSHA biogenesis protein MshO